MKKIIEKLEMKAIILKKYNDKPDLALTLSDCAKPIPEINQVLIQIHAASMNPIDTRIRAGYGQTLFASKAPLPIVLGRDFSGVIIDRGKVVTGYEIGDEVFGVVSPFRPSGMKSGSHSEFVCVPIEEITKKPKNITHLDAASLPYVALTTYNALLAQTGMKIDDFVGKTVFVHAGAGGVGSYAIQFLKALGARVVTTCSTKNVEFVQTLGADEVIDYTKEDYVNKIKNCDVAYDLLGKSHMNSTLGVLKDIPLPITDTKEIDSLFCKFTKELELADDSWSVPKYKSIIKSFDSEILKILPSTAARYVSIVGPMMPLTDAKGLHAGMREFVSLVLKYKAEQAKHHGRTFNYSVFEPNLDALELLAKYVSIGLIKPIVNSVYPMEKASEAHLALETGHTRGKIVLSMV